jgi:MOSC domain-containing protein YiiM
MDPVVTVPAIAGVGINGNANRGGRRQVTVLGREGWSDACREIGVDLDPTHRRANLLIEGIDLRDSTNRILQVGSVAIGIRGETRPCGRMERASPGLYRALLFHWRGGVYGEILTGGELTSGDRVDWGVEG